MAELLTAAESREPIPLTWRYALALMAGAMTPLSFAPFNAWPISFFTLAFLFYCLQHTTPREAGRLGFAFGFGLFGVGASWIYVSIHDYGLLPAWGAGFITLVFVAFMALYNAVQCWLWRRYASSYLPALTFAATWVLGEVFRAWFLTGFPWLFLGYAHVTSPLSGLAPIFGVYGLSFMVALSGALLMQIATAIKTTGFKPALIKQPSIIALIILQAVAAGTTPINWTHAAARDPVSVGLVQANIPQSLKFDKDAIQDGLDRHVALSAPLWKQDLLVWPETAIPLVYQSQNELMTSLAAQARSNNTALLTGIFYRSERGLHNSIVVVGNGSGVWLKQKLVPFGEYVPFNELIGSVLAMFAMPMSSQATGTADQPLLTAAGLQIAPYICYEVVYPDFARRVGRDADLLLTISNDTWFGTSFGPLQHLQIASMRARELGRYMVRATNNGVSAFINPRGEILAQTAQFKAETLQGSVLVFEGHTPFARWGSLPVWLFSVAIIALALSQRYRQQR